MFFSLFRPTLLLLIKQAKSRLANSILAKHKQLNATYAFFPLSFPLIKSLAIYIFFS